MAKIRTDEADGLTVQDVMHARFGALPATATVGDVRDYVAASTSRRLAFLASDDGTYAGSLTPAHVADGDPGRPATEVADSGPTVSPADAATTGRDIALRTDSRRVPVVDGGRLLGVVAITGDLQSFCGTATGDAAATADVSG
jgi:CBS domain-containing protein